MDSLKIRDKKNGLEQPEEVVEKQEIIDTPKVIVETPEFRTEEIAVPETANRRRDKPTIGQKIMESVKKFFEEVE